MTTGFSAGVETNDVALSYGVEAVWGTKPAVAFKSVRMTSESFSGSKSRSRPAEIRTDYQASAAVTTQEQATAGINLAFSAGTYDDLLAGLLMGAWGAAGTGGAAAGVERLTNGTLFTSFWFQKRLSDTMYLEYPGTYWSGGSLSASTGQFLTGSLTGMAKDEQTATTSQSTGAILAAPTGRVMDTVAGFNGLFIDGTPIDAVADAITLNITKEGAAAQFGLGSAAAQGMLRGTFTLSGTLRTYFRTFDLYQAYKAETYKEVSFEVDDLDGVKYKLIVPAATLMNPSITAGGPGGAVMAEFAIEGNPDPVTGKTLIIDRTPAP
jgi:hypothetical protein